MQREVICREVSKRNSSVLVCSGLLIKERTIYRIRFVSIILAVIWNCYIYIFSSREALWISIVASLAGSVIILWFGFRKKA
jgi:hypothetical protein